MWSANSPYQPKPVTFSARSAELLSREYCTGAEVESIIEQYQIEAARLEVIEALVAPRIAYRTMQAGAKPRQAFTPDQIEAARKFYRDRMEARIAAVKARKELSQ